MKFLNLVGNLRDSLSADNEEHKYLVFVTKNGIIKRTELSEFDNIRKSGKIAITLKEDDELIYVGVTTGNDEIAIGSNNGRMVRFNEDEVRVMGRTASGVKGIELDDSKVIGAEVLKQNQLILIVTENGYGKKSEIDEYRLTHRGSKGVKALNITDKNGMMVALKCVNPENESDLMIMTDSGVIIKLPLEQVSTLKRATQGIRLINLKDDQKVSTVAIVDKEDDTEENSENEEQSSVEKNISSEENTQTNEISK